MDIFNQEGRCEMQKEMSLKGYRTLFNLCVTQTATPWI